MDTFGWAVPSTKQTQHHNRVSTRGLLGEGGSKRPCWNGDMREAGRQRDWRRGAREEQEAGEEKRGLREKEAREKTGGKKRSKRQDWWETRERAVLRQALWRGHRSQSWQWKAPGDRWWHNCFVGRGGLLLWQTPPNWGFAMQSNTMKYKFHMG